MTTTATDTAFHAPVEVRLEASQYTARVISHARHLCISSASISCTHYKRELLSRGLHGKVAYKIIRRSYASELPSSDTLHYMGIFRPNTEDLTPFATSVYMVQYHVQGNAAALNASDALHPSTVGMSKSSAPQHSFSCRSTDLWEVSVQCGPAPKPYPENCRLSPRRQGMARHSMYCRYTLNSEP